MALCRGLPATEKNPSRLPLPPPGGAADPPARRIQPTLRQRRPACLCARLRCLRPTWSGRHLRMCDRDALTRARRPYGPAARATGPSQRRSQRRARRREREKASERANNLREAKLTRATWSIANASKQAIGWPPAKCRAKQWPPSSEPPARLPNQLEPIELSRREGCFLGGKCSCSSCLILLAHCLECLLLPAGQRLRSKRERISWLISWRVWERAREGFEWWTKFDCSFDWPCCWRHLSSNQQGRETPIKGANKPPSGRLALSGSSAHAPELQQWHLGGRQAVT